MTNPAYEATNSDVEKVEKKKYPSDNYLNEILTNTEFAAVVPIEAVRCMARELMLLRTSAPNSMMQLSNELAEMKLPEDFPDDAELLIEIEFLDDESVDIKTAQWLKELRRRRVGTAEGE